MVMVGNTVSKLVSFFKDLSCVSHCYTRGTYGGNVLPAVCVRHNATMHTSTMHTSLYY